MHDIILYCNCNSMCCAQPAAQQRGIARAWLQECGFSRKFIRKSFEQLRRAGLGGPRETPESQELNQERPRWTNMAPRASKESLQSDPSSPQERTRAAKSAPRVPQERPRASQERPRAIKSASQRGLQANPRANHRISGNPAPV